MKNKVHNYLNPDLVETGEKIRALRESKGMSQEQLAALLGVNKNSISRYENGQMEMGINVLYSLSDIFNVAPNTLSPSRFCKEVDSIRFDEIRELFEQLNESNSEVAYITNITMLKAMINAQ